MATTQLSIALASGFSKLRSAVAVEDIDAVVAGLRSPRTARRVRATFEARRRNLGLSEEQYNPSAEESAVQVHLAVRGKAQVSVWLNPVTRRLARTFRQSPKTRAIH
jgi:hypothetical protein